MGCKFFQVLHRSHQVDCKFLPVGTLFLQVDDMLYRVLQYYLEHCTFASRVHCKFASRVHCKFDVLAVRKSWIAPPPSHQVWSKSASAHCTFV